MSERDIPIDETSAGDSREDSDREAIATEEREAEAGEPGAGTAEAETAEALEEEIQRLTDRLLRLQAEFDNYRKREARERAAAWGRAKADLSQKLLGSLDDLARVAHLDPARTGTAAVVEGVSLVERKIFETLEREGLSTVGEVGEPFDPNVHEAVGVFPAESPEDDGRIAAVVSRGYRFGEQLLRPARVQVYGFREAGSSSSEE